MSEDKSAPEIPGLSVEEFWAKLRSVRIHSPTVGTGKTRLATLDGEPVAVPDPTGLTPAERLALAQKLVQRYSDF
jgi:hypothetical protein